MSAGPRIALIAALSRNRVIGSGNRLPWELPEDLRHFRRITLGHPVLMGRRTYESIGRPLPGRENWILSRQPGLTIPGCTVVSSLDEAISRIDSSQEWLFVIGGAEVYSQAISSADRLILTLIDREYPGDAFFPEWRTGEFTEVSSEDGYDEKSGVSYRFTEWQRATPAPL